MRPGRETDVRVAKEIFGYEVWVEKKNLMENHPKGNRPLRHYTSEMDAAMEVATHMKVALFPVAGDQWFAFVGPERFNQGWESPQALLQFLESGDFNECGAAVGDKPASLICKAALKAAEKRRQAAGLEAGQTGEQTTSPQLEVVEGGINSETSNTPELH